jgi:hypothetical protein
MTNQIRHLNPCTIKSAAFSKYVKWSAPRSVTLDGRSVRLNGFFSTAVLKSRTPFRLYVDEFISGQCGYWYFEKKIFETSGKYLSEDAFLKLHKEWTDSQ